MQTLGIHTSDKQVRHIEAEATVQISTPRGPIEWGSREVSASRARDILALARCRVVEIAIDLGVRNGQPACCADVVRKAFNHPRAVEILLVSQAKVPESERLSR